MTRRRFSRSSPDLAPLYDYRPSNLPKQLSVDPRTTYRRGFCFLAISLWWRAYIDQGVAKYWPESHMALHRTCGRSVVCLLRVSQENPRSTYVYTVCVLSMRASDAFTGIQFGGGLRKHLLCSVRVARHGILRSTRSHLRSPAKGSLKLMVSSIYCSLYPSLLLESP